LVEVCRARFFCLSNLAFACFSVQALAKYDRAIAGSRTKPTSIDREVSVIAWEAPVGWPFLVPGWYDCTEEVVTLGLDPGVVEV